MKQNYGVCWTYLFRAIACWAKSNDVRLLTSPKQQKEELKIFKRFGVGIFDGRYLSSKRASYLLLIIKLNTQYHTAISKTCIASLLCWWLVRCWFYFQLNLIIYRQNRSIKLMVMALMGAYLDLMVFLFSLLEKVTSSNLAFRYQHPSNLNLL